MFYITLPIPCTKPLSICLLCLVMSQCVYTHMKTFSCDTSTCVEGSVTSRWKRKSTSWSPAIRFQARPREIALASPCPLSVENVSVVRRSSRRKYCSQKYVPASIGWKSLITSVWSGSVVTRFNASSSCLSKATSATCTTQTN